MIDQIDIEPIKISQSVYEQIELQQNLLSGESQTVKVENEFVSDHMNRQNDAVQDYNEAVMTRQDVLMTLVRLMPRIPYDWLKDSFHYTLLEDLVILCCTDAMSRSHLLEQTSLKTTALKSNTFWKIVRQLTGLRRTIHSIVSRYRYFWENLHPKELVKFLPYLQDRRFDYVVKLRKDVFDQMTYVQEIVKSFYKPKTHKQFQWRKNATDKKREKRRARRMIGPQEPKPQFDPTKSSVKFGTMSMFQKTPHRRQAIQTMQANLGQASLQDGQLYSYGTCGSFQTKQEVKEIKVEDQRPPQELIKVDDQGTHDQENSPSIQIEFVSAVEEILYNENESKRTNQLLNTNENFTDDSLNQEKQQIGHI